MSLSTPKIKNPCKKFIEFKGNTGVFQFWNKEKKETEQVALPISFIVLDELSTITGFSDMTQSGIYSNEVHSLKDETLNVRTFKGGLKVVGLYADIKGKIAEMGGKFCKSVYAGLITKEGLELVNFQLKGISFSSWLNKEFDVTTSGVTIEDCSDGKKGAVKYKIPNYKSLEVADILMDEAKELDKVIQSYLIEYKSNQSIFQPEPEVENESESPKAMKEPPPDYTEDEKFVPDSRRVREVEKYKKVFKAEDSNLEDDIPF